jgi:hypothetical protein
MFMKINDFASYSSSRAYLPLYYSESINHCPACTRSQWHIGRTTAQCAFCDAALPLASISSQPVRPLFFQRGKQIAA